MVPRRLLATVAFQQQPGKNLRKMEPTRRDELRRAVRFSVADENTKLDQLKKSGRVADVEYGRLRDELASRETWPFCNRS